MNFYMLKPIGLIMATAAISLSAQAQNMQPLIGTYDCKMSFQHMMKGAGMAMISGASCTLEADKANTTTFTNNVMFDDKGVGKLINSNGVTMHDGKPLTAYVGNESTWQLEMKDGQMVGYTARGNNDIVAGENAGKSIHWVATPTGADTLKIKYEVK